MIVLKIVCLTLPSPLLCIKNGCSAIVVVVVSSSSRLLVVAQLIVLILLSVNIKIVY